MANCGQCDNYERITDMRGECLYLEKQVNARDKDCDDFEVRESNNDE